MFTTVSLRSVLTWSATISIFDTFYFSCFRKGKKAAKAHKEICEVCGVNCLTVRMCQNLFKKFPSGDFSLKDNQRSDRPSEVDDDIMKDIIETNRLITVRKIAKQFNVSHATIENHIDICVPYELKEIHLTQRINICYTHFKRNAIDPFLK